MRRQGEDPTSPKQGQQKEQTMNCPNCGANEEWIEIGGGWGGANICDNCGHQWKSEEVKESPKKHEAPGWIVGGPKESTTGLAQAHREAEQATCIIYNARRATMTAEERAAEDAEASASINAAPNRIWH